MNCGQAQQYWDRYRDDGGADLPPERRDELAAHLRACPACAALWREETAWLRALADEEKPTADGAAFTAAVLQRWEESGAASPSPSVLKYPTEAASRASIVCANVARPNIWRQPRRLAAAVLMTAALVALAIVLIQRLGHDATPISPALHPNPIVKRPPLPGDPLGEMARQMDHLYNNPPMQILTQWQQSLSNLDLAVLVSRLDLPVPDPAQYLQPIPPQPPPPDHG